MLTSEKIHSNWAEFMVRIKNLSPDRQEALVRMYEDLENAAVFAPASSYDFFHNAFPGGYIDHVLRVHDNAKILYHVWKKVGMKVDNFTEEELYFAALHHDLGKLGLPGSGNEHYVPETSDWHKKNQGKMYKTNPNVPKVTTFDNTLFLFNYYGIKYTFNEMIGIRCTDGMYEESNKDYLAGFSVDTKVRNNMPYILHHADIMAFRFEFERWNNSTNKLKMTLDFSAQAEIPKETPKKKQNPAFDENVFASIFGGGPK